MRIQFVAGIELEAYLEVSSVVIERMSAARLKDTLVLIFFPLASLVRVHMSPQTRPRFQKLTNQNDLINDTEHPGLHISQSRRTPDEIQVAEESIRS